MLVLTPPSRAGGAVDVGDVSLSGIGAGSVALQMANGAGGTSCPSNIGTTIVSESITLTKPLEVDFTYLPIAFFGGYVQFGATAPTSMYFNIVGALGSPLVYLPTEVLVANAQRTVTGRMIGLESTAPAGTLNLGTFGVSCVPLGAAVTIRGYFNVTIELVAVLAGFP